MRVKDIRHKASARIDTKLQQQLGIQTYGDDNLYPQTLHNIISASSTGAECNDRYADFIEGNGFTDERFSATVVNRSGDTADDIHTLVCRDIAEFGGMALHVNYNLYGQIVELHHVPFENCRLCEEDDNGYISEIAVHPDWTGQKKRGGKTLRVSKENVDYIDVFNPAKDVVLAQIERSGGIEFYKGQILWVSLSGHNQYPTGKADRVITEMSTDEGLANVKYRNVRNNFLPFGMVVTKKSSNITHEDEDSIIDSFSDDDGFSDELLNFQGDTNACKLFEVTTEADEEEPIFKPLQGQNYDKEFTVTDASVIERIYSAYGQEAWYCIRSGKLGFSGDILEDAFEYYNSIVSKQQRTIERMFKRIFAFWFEDVNPTKDYSVTPLYYVRNAKISNNPVD